MKRFISAILSLVIMVAALNIGAVTVFADGLKYTEEDLESGRTFTPMYGICIGRAAPGDNNYLAQSFVANGEAVTGCKIHLQVVDTVTVTVQIRSSLDGANSSVLFSQNFPLSASPHSITDWWNFDFSRAVKTEKDKTYYLVFWADTYHSACAASNAIYTASVSVNPSYRMKDNATEWTVIRSRTFGYEIFTDQNAVPEGYPYAVNDNVLMLHDAEEYYCFNREDDATKLNIWSKNASQGYYSMSLVSKAQTADKIGAYIDFDETASLDTYEYFYTDIYLGAAASEGLSFNFTLLDANGKGMTCRTDISDKQKGWHRICRSKSDFVKVADGDFEGIVSVYISFEGTDQNAFVCVDNVRAAKSEIPLYSSNYYKDEDLENISDDDVLVGDVNADGSVNSGDALLALQTSVQKIEPNAYEFIASDTDGSVSVNSVDALAILQYGVGKIDCFAVDNMIEKSDVEDFVISTEGLEKNTVYTISTDTIKNFNDGIMPHDVARLVSSLQGLINRELQTTRVALVLVDNYTETWMSYIKENDPLLSGMENTVNIETFDEFLAVFEKQLVQCGMILWDPNVPATANVAQTICALDGYIPVKYLTDENSLYNRLVSMGVEVKQNLVDMFDGECVIANTQIQSTGSKKNDPYLWALQKYSARCSKKYLVYTPDGASSTEGNIIYENDIHSKSLDYNHSFGYDYAIMRKAFCFDLTADESEPPCDDPEQVTGTDVATLEKILVNRYYRACGTFGEIVGFPPWPIKYTSHNGWNTIKDTELEGKFTSLVTKFNNYMDADGSITNCSIYCQFTLEDKYESVANNKPVTEQYDENTVYMYMYTGDYDSAAWSLDHLYRCYNDESRGEIPITWSITPGLSDRIPMLFDYLYKNQTENDYFSASDSGVGYIRPQGIFKSTSDRYLPDGDREFLKISKEYFEKFDMDSVGFIIGRLSDEVCTLYNQFAPIGSNTNDTTWSTAVYGDTPYIRIKNGIGNPPTNDEEMKTIVSGMLEFAQGNKEYNVAGYRTIKYTAADLKNVQEAFVEYAAEHDPDTTYKFVDYKTYFAMLRASTNGKYTLE